MESSIKPIIASVIVGGVFSAIVYSCAFALSIVYYGSNSGWIGHESDWWFAGIIVGIPFGLLIGCITGGLIGWFDLSVIRSIFFCGGLNLILMLILLFLLGNISQGIAYSLYSIVPVGLISGAVIGIFNAIYRSPLSQ